MKKVGLEKVLFTLVAYCYIILVRKAVGKKEDKKMKLFSLFEEET